MQLNHIQATRHGYDYVYISPHFDDVAASCGGRILNHKKAGKSVLVVTVFSARSNQTARASNNALKAMLAYDRRREEDLEAMQRLVVDFLWLEFPEVLFRRQPPWRRYGLTFPDTAANHRLCHQVTIKLNDICRQTRCKELVLPMGIGQHVDHQIIFQAGLSHSHNSHSQQSTLFYEEIPYALFPFLRNYRLKKIVTGGIEARHQHQIPTHTSQLSTKNLVRLLTAMPSLGLQPQPYRPWVFLLLKTLDLCTRYMIRPSTTHFSPSRIKPEAEDITSAINQKVAAIAAYGSQISDSSMGSHAIKKWLAAYSNDMGMSPGSYGELYWRVI
jgi:LmbE family N-acetylglucosaminyl deacetylase